MSYLDPYFIKYSCTASRIWAFIVMSRLIPVSLRRLCISVGITTVTRLCKMCKSFSLAYFWVDGEPDRPGLCWNCHSKWSYVLTVLQFYSLLRSSFFQPHLLCSNVVGMTGNMLIENEQVLDKNYVNYTSRSIYLFFYYIQCLLYLIPNKRGKREEVHR